MKKRRLSERNSMMNLDNDLVKKNHQKWAKFSNLLTYSLLSKTSDIPVVSRFNNVDHSATGAASNDCTTKIAITKEICSALNEIMNRINCERTSRVNDGDRNHDVDEAKGINSRGGVSDTSSNLYSDLEDSLEEDDVENTKEDE